MTKKLINGSLLIMVLLSVSMIAQKKTFLQKITEDYATDQSYPVDARLYLERFNKANGIDEAKIAQENNLYKSNKTTWNFVIGSQKNWWASNFVSNTFYTTPTTCRAVGAKCYIFVEDSLWNTRVDQAAVDAVQNAFDSSTPANPNKGIYQTDVDTFGDPPNIDGDPKIIILILNIRDGYSGTGGYVAGYFYSVNESLTNPNSNQAEIYYLDANPLNLRNSNGITTGMKTAAHEFQHMIHYNYIQGSETFFNEGWSLVAEVVCGYSLYNQSYFLGETNHFLLDWRSGDNTAVLKDYSRAARFALYLKEQFGTAILKNYLNNRINGVTGLNLYMASVGSRTFSSVLTDWFLANFLNENVGNNHPEWVYTYTPMTKVTSNATYTNPNISNGMTSGLYKYSAEYLTFNSCKNLNINFNTAGNGYIKIKAIKVNASAKVIDDVTPGTNYSMQDLGTTYSSVTFMIYHNNGNDGYQGPTVYTFNSTGTAVNTVQEIAYDSTEPVGVYVLTVGDTCAVQFDGINGTHLDSIRVALRNMVSIEGGVWRWSVSKFLSQRLAGPFYISGTTTPTVINQGGTYPYEQPYKNWVKFDVRSLGIDASTNFVVGFVIDGVYQSSSSPTNRVMHTTIPGSSPYHSYTYLHNPTSGTPGWYYIGDITNNNISLYLIRAYVSTGVTGINEPIELLPSLYSLEQNYPNPFNPETVISFTLPKNNNVQIRIFDALGREVRTLIDEERTAGKHNIYWNGTDNYGKRVSSGIYFYTIHSGSFSETKKMILMK